MIDEDDVPTEPDCPSSMHVRRHGCLPDPAGIVPNWEALELYRRVAFIGVLPLLSSKADRRAAIGVLFSIVSLAVYGEVGPFQQDSTKILARTAQYTIFMTFGCGKG